MLGFTCQAVRGFSLICSLFRARLCWGDSVANEGLCYISEYDVTLDMGARIRPADWRAAAQSLPADRKPASLVWQLARSSHQGRTYSRMLRVNHGFMWNAKFDVLRCMSQKKGLVNIYVMDMLLCA